MSNITRSAEIYGRGLADLDMQQEADSWFDGGEYSGRFWEKAKPKLIRVLQHRARVAGHWTRSRFNQLLRDELFQEYVGFYYDDRWEEVRK